MALALAVCLLVTMLPGTGLLPQVEAAANQWNKFNGSGTVTPETATPTNVAIAGGSTMAYYDQAIDVQVGTKVSFKVQFTNLVANANLHYGFALTDATGGYWSYGTKPNSIELELVSTVTGGANGALQAHATKMTAGGTRTGFGAFASALATPRNNTDVYDVAFERINVTEGGVNYIWKLTVSKAGGTVYTYRYKAADLPQNLFANGAYFTTANMGGGGHTVKVTGLTVTQPAPAPTGDQWVKFDGTGTIAPEAEKPANVSVTGAARAHYTKKIEVVENTKIAFKVQFTNLVANANLHFGFALTDATGGYWSYGTKPNSIELELVNLATTGSTALRALPSKIAAGGTRTAYADLTGALANPVNTTDIYDVSFQRINETEGGVNYSWLLTLTKGTTSYTYKYKTSDLPANLFANGAYLTASNMGSGGHTVKVTDLTVTVEQPPVEPPQPPQPDPAGWNMVQGAAAGLVPESAGAFNATFDNYVTGYYNDKIEVEENTAISFKVQFPELNSGVLLQYAFSLVDKDKSFYISDTAANSMSVEMTSTVSGGTAGPLTVIASKKAAGATARTWLANVAGALANRNTADVYDVKFKKIDETEGGVNYSWLLTVSKGSDSYTYKYKATDIPHDLFEDGAYLALGSMAGSTTHTVKVSDLTVQVEEEPVLPPPPVEDPAGWNVVQGVKDNLTVDSLKPENATFQSYVTAYYNNKITVEENTTISFKVNFPAISDGVLLQYAFSLVDKDKSFYISDTAANSMSLELTSAITGGTAAPLSATASKKAAGATARTFLSSVAASLANPRNTTDVYDVTFRKVNITEGGVNYSWKLTVSKNGGGYTYLYKAADIPHDLFANGAYFAVGSMAGSTTHTLKVTDLKVEVKEEDAPLPPPADPAGWNVVAGSGLTAEGKNATIKNYGTAYYNEKIEVKEGTTVSFDVSMPAMTAGEAAHYGFSLVDKAKSFYASDNVANSLTVELQSIREVNKKWPVNAVVSMKKTGGSRVWVANLGGGLSADRDTKATYTITFRKINETVDNINYSWYVTIKCGDVSAGYAVKATDIPHDQFASGAYLACGAMMGVSNHTVKITNLSRKVATDKFNTDLLVDMSGIWKVVRGYSGIAGKGLTYKSGAVTMEGFGGTAYMKDAVKNAVSVEFTLNKYDAKRGDFFSFGVVNKEGVYYNPNGQESQGVYVRIKDVNGKLSVVVYTVDKNGSVAIGELTSTTKAKGVKHYVTFFREGGKWFVALDSKQKLRIDEKVQLTDFGHLVAGATQGKDQSMTITKVSVDSAVTAGMKAGALKAGYKINGFQIIRGYGVGNPATGKGLSDKNGKTQMQGYGGIAYTGGAAKNAVAVDFEMNAFEGNSYFFSFGLLNKEGVYYNPNGQESQGIYVRIKSWVNGMGLNVTVFNLTKAGSEELGTITSKIPPKNQKHNLAIFQEDGVWYVGIDGNQKMQLNVDVNLGKANYLVAGASTTPELTMTVGKVYMDGKVTEEMKAGAVVMSATADSQVGEGDASGGTSTEKGDGNEFVTQEGNDGPGNVVASTGNQTLVWVLCGLVACAALAAGYILVFAKKKEK